MTNCEQFELALERRAAGELTSERHSALRAHLESCVSCRVYAHTMQRTETMIRDANAAVAARDTWQLIHRHVERREREGARLRKRLRWGAFLMGMLFCVATLTGAGWLRLFSVGALVTCVLELALLPLRDRRVLRLARADADLLLLLRREARWRLVWAMIGVLTAVGFSVVWYAASQASAPGWVLRTTGNPGRPLALAMAGGFLLLAAYFLFVTMRRALREHAALAGSGEAA